MTDTRASYGRDVWMALAAIGWSDGHLDQNEADALVRTALDEGAELDEISDLDEATKKPISLGDIDLSKLTKEDRLFIYAVACWITRIDGKVTEPEVDSLNKLGELLRVPEKPRQHAENIVKEVSQTCVDIRPAFFNLSLIKSMITERLAEAKKIKEAMKTDGEEDNEKDEESNA